MSSPRRAVLFDLDGTLIDTAPDFHACLNRLRAEEGLAPLEFAAVRAEVSNGGSAMIRLGFDLEREAPAFQPLLQRLLDHYSAHIADHSRLFAGMEALLAWLEANHWPWGIVTNKPERFAVPLLTALGLEQRCAVLVCPDRLSRTKPDPEGLLLASRRLACPPPHCIYVGDHPRDIAAGRNAAMTTVTALFGYLPADSAPLDWGADFNAASPAALLAWLQTLSSSRSSTGTEHV